MDGFRHQRIDLNRLHRWLFGRGNNANFVRTLHFSSRVVCRSDRTGWLRRERLAVLRQGWRRLDEPGVHGRPSLEGLNHHYAGHYDNRTEFTVGAGFEFELVENLSAKVDYDFYDSGSKNYNFAAITPVSVRSDLHALTVDLNYKFNWSGGPKP